ncbi:MAG: hypothetical protein Q7K43_01500, partial [Candidatus Woesearchaeota archaeon]|nr:hypothetical protein [Candidatus Woesearchaeota archaeon]
MTFNSVRQRLPPRGFTANTKRKPVSKTWREAPWSSHDDFSQSFAPVRVSRAITENPVSINGTNYAIQTAGLALIAVAALSLGGCKKESGQGYGAPGAEKTDAVAKDPHRGGLIDEVWEHPELPLLGPDEYEDKGKIIRVEAYHNTDFFEAPQKVYRDVSAVKQESPVEVRIRLEEKLTGQKLDDRVKHYFNNVSNETGSILAQKLRTNTISEANQQATNKEFFEAVAQAFRHGNAVYKEEELYRVAFDKAKHRGNHVHLDCNLLAEGFVHVAQNYGRKVSLMLGESHMFLVTKDGTEVEATAFRDEKVSEETRTNKRGTVPYTIVIHTDAHTKDLLTPKDTHLKYDYRNSSLTQSPEAFEHNVPILKKRGTYVPLTARDIEEVIEGALRGHLARKLADAKDSQFRKSVDEYITFAQTVKNPWVAVNGFNMLVALVNEQVKQFKTSDKTYDCQKATSSLSKLLKAMDCYAKNHEAVQELGKNNVRRMKLQLTYMQDSTNLDKALLSADRESFIPEGRQQFDDYVRVLKHFHANNKIADVISIVHCSDVAQEISVPLAETYCIFIARNQPEKKRLLYDTI